MPHEQRRDRPPARAEAPSASTPAPTAPSARSEIDAFLAAARSMALGWAGGRGRLIFALDATMSRQPTWDRACALQAGMFEAASGLGGLSVQLVYYRGLGECRASRWVADGGALAELMSTIACRGGQTQIGRVLAHARNAAAKEPVRALVFVGDAMEEPLDPLCAVAGELKLLGAPAFVFQEGREPVAERAFREIARLSGGAWCPFDHSSAAELADLLRAVAVYAAGGVTALEDLSRGPNGGARRLLSQMRPA